MNSSVRNIFLATLGLSAASAVAAQDFPDRTVAWNLVHDLATGFDSVADSSVNDWTQRGVALGDIDGDGDVDAIFAGGVLPNSVMRNDGGTFTDITATAGIEVGDFDTAPCLADFDLDGDLDLFIGVVESGGGGAGGVPASRFYRNDGTGAFTEITTLAWTRGGGHSIFAQWADMDLDGLADLLVSEFYTLPNEFYRNNGDGTFSDLSAATGLDGPGSTHATCIVDSDDDGYLDLFVGNDYIVSFWASLPNNVGDQHIAGQSDGTWLNVTPGSGFEHIRGIMGFAVGDVDYDGDYDLYKTDVEANRLTINEGWPAGSAWLPEEQYVYGIEADWMPWPEHPDGEGKIISWGAMFANFDFDPWLDLVIANGQVAGFNATQQFSPRDQPNQLFLGNGPGAGFTFTDQAPALGFADPIDDRCLAVSDLDQDGDLDVIITPSSGPVRLYENQIDPAGQGWLMVKPITTTSAPGGFGVEVKYTDNLGYPHIRQIGLDGPTASQHENFAHFGLGTQTSVDLTIEYPSGLVMSIPGVTPNQVLTPVEPLLVEVNARTMPIGPNPRRVGTVGSPGGASPLGLYAVTAYAHDSAGTPLDGTAVVTIETPGLIATTGVLHLGGNMFRRYFQAPATPGEFRSEVTFDGFACRIRPRVIFYDPADASGTTGRVVPEGVRAGSGDTFEVIVAPKDANGISLGSGDTIDIQIAGLTPLSGPTDLGDGRYSASFGAPATTGKHLITVTHNGSPLTMATPLHIEAGGSTITAKSTLVVEEPNIFTSGTPWQFKMLLTPRDIDSNRLGPYTDVQLVLNATGGTPPLTIRTDLHPDGQADGSHPFILEKPNTDPPTDVTGTIQVWIDGNLQFQMPYDW